LIYIKLKHPLTLKLRRAAREAVTFANAMMRRVTCAKERVVRSNQ